MAGRVPFLNYEQMAQIADRFLNQHNNQGTLPVDIELMLEQAGLIIIPIEGLYRDFSIDGFLSADLQHIYVDERW